MGRPGRQRVRIIPPHYVLWKSRMLRRSSACPLRFGMASMGTGPMGRLPRMKDAGEFRLISLGVEPRLDHALAWGREPGHLPGRGFLSHVEPFGCQEG